MKASYANLGMNDTPLGASGKPCFKPFVNENIFIFGGVCAFPCLSALYTRGPFELEPGGPPPPPPPHPVYLLAIGALALKSTHTDTGIRPNLDIFGQRV